MSGKRATSLEEAFGMSKAERIYALTDYQLERLMFWDAYIDTRTLRGSAAA